MCVCVFSFFFILGLLFEFIVCQGILMLENWESNGILTLQIELMRILKQCVRIYFLVFEAAGSNLTYMAWITGIT